MLMIMTSVAALTILATNSALPGYGVNSSLSHSQSQASGRFDAGKDCAIAAILMSANHYHRRLAHAKQIGRGIFNPHPNGISGRQVDPIERSLHIRQTRL